MWSSRPPLIPCVGGCRKTTRPGRPSPSGTTPLKAALEERLAQLANEAETLADDGAPRLLAGHFTLEGAAWGS